MKRPREFNVSKVYCRHGIVPSSNDCLFQVQPGRVIDIGGGSGRLDAGDVFHPSVLSNDRKCANHMVFELIVGNKVLFFGFYQGGIELDPHDKSQFSN